ncbi:MAG TPA: glycoside hydrolase family 28 protein [Steroidobacteraceae bacterium]
MSRRGFVACGGAALGSALCGFGAQRTTATATASISTLKSTGPTDPIWGVHGVATTIIRSLRHLTAATFPAASFPVTHFGARRCRVIAQSNPYTGALPSPLSAGAERTAAPDSFDCRPAFLAAIAACNAAGGGRVLVPAGNWYCAGPIVLLSHVNFHLAARCTIYFSPRPRDYAKDGPFDCGPNGRLYYCRWQGNDCLSFGSPVYARNATRIALTGEGPSSVLNGQAMTAFAGSGSTSTCWWTYKGIAGKYGCVDAATPSQAYTNPNNRDLREIVPDLPTELYGRLTDPQTPWQRDESYLPALSEAGVAAEHRVFGLGHYLRPCMIELLGCTDVLLQNYCTQNTPFWQHHPTGCTNVLIRGVTADSIGPNNDGFDPDSCHNVLCEAVTFNTGDDCIAIDSGKDRDVGLGPAQDHVIQHCIMNSGHGGLALGSLVGGGVRGVYARGLTMRNSNWASNPLNIAIRIKSNLNRGGTVENVHIRDIDLPHGVCLHGANYASSLLAGSPINKTVPVGVATRSAANPSSAQGGLITIDCDYMPAGDALRTRPPALRNIHIANVRARDVTLNGVTGSCFQALVIQGPVTSDYNGPQPAPPIVPIQNITISDCDFGSPTARGPASPSVPGPIYAYNVRDVILQNVRIGDRTYNTVISDVRDGRA